MNIRSFLFTAGTLACLAGGAAFHSAPAKAENAPLVIAQNDNDEDTGFWDRIFNRSDGNRSAKPLFLDRPAASPGRSTPYNYGSQNAGQDRSKPFTDADGLKIMRERDAAVQKRTDELLRLAAIENEKRAAALEKDILESNTRAAAEKAGTGKNTDSNTKMVYDPQKAKNYNPNPAPYTARPRGASGTDPEERQKPAPTGRLYNVR